MNRTQAKVWANQIFSISQSPEWPERLNDASLTFGIGPGAIYISETDRQLFDTNIQLLYSINKEIESSFTLVEFKNRFISQFRINMQNQAHIEQEMIDSFFAELLTIPVESYIVTREIFGITISDKTQVIKFGPFMVFPLELLPLVVPKSNPKTIDMILGEDKPEFLIAVQASARHSSRANEIADLLFDKFEKTFKFMIGYNSGRYRTGILNYYGSKLENAYIFIQDGRVSSSHRVNGTHEKVNISDPYFSDPELGHDRIWQLYSSTNRNNLQERILLAVEWLGQAYGEISKASAFLKCAISLEIIFTYNEKTIITPSILNQITESTAMLLGDTVENRLEIEKTIKSLYSQRSAIVHAGNTFVKDQEIYDFYYLAKSVISKLITHPDLSSIPSIEALYTTLKHRKYTSAAFEDSHSDS